MIETSLWQETILQNLVELLWPNQDVLAEGIPRVAATSVGLARTLPLPDGNNPGQAVAFSRHSPGRRCLVDARWRYDRRRSVFPLDRILRPKLCLVDQTENYSFSPQDLKDWPGEILYVCGSEDPASPPEKRQAMRELYPQAAFKVIEGGKHGISHTHPQEYYGAIDEFLGK